MRAADLGLVDDLFEMSSGYVLDFNNRTFSEFFRDELSIDIDDPRLSAEGNSKAKRLRYLLRVSNPNTRIRVLLALWDYRQDGLRRTRRDETIPGAEEEFYALLERLGGKRRQPKRHQGNGAASGDIDDETHEKLKRKLIEVSNMEPQARGYAFEGFLKELFSAHGLAPRASFRLVGEQIDGSFELMSETYLLEAKWQGGKIGAADLRAFNAKAEDKAAWTRGLFVSVNGFTEDGLAAFGRGKRLICMDGLDLSDMFDRRLSLAVVVRLKARRLAETGNPFERVRDLV
jgi:hypothetical protein